MLGGRGGFWRQRGERGGEGKERRNVLLGEAGEGLGAVLKMGGGGCSETKGAGARGGLAGRGRVAVGSWVGGWGGLRKPGEKQGKGGGGELEAGGAGAQQWTRPATASSAAAFHLGIYTLLSSYCALCSVLHFNIAIWT